MSLMATFAVDDGTAPDIVRNKFTNRKQTTVRRIRLLWIFVGLAICSLFFLVGFLGGLFTPRESNVSAETRKWIDQPCTVLDTGHCPAGYDGTPPVIVISFDGFRAEYLSRNLTRALDKVRKCGVHTSALRPTHPAITFPNHYSIATGLHAESHGIVDNKFFDTELRKEFDYKISTVVRDPMWWKGEPIWVTARKHGKISNAYFWVGTEARIQGYFPNEYYVYNGSHSFEQRVDKVIEWISYPKDKRPDITMLYFEEPDSSGHKFGTHSDEVETAMKRVDATLERLMEGLFKKELLGCINIVIVSDHGMKNADCKDSIGLMPILRTANITTDDFFFRGGVQGRISLKNNSNTTINKIYESLKCPSPPNDVDEEPYQLYKKENLPRRLHYSNSPRLEPIIINLKEGRQIWPTVNTNATCLGGWHGYDNLYPSMDAIFMAQGPSFKTQFETEPFQNIEIYNLLCDLLRVEPASNNGTHGSLHKLLKTPTRLTVTPFRKDPKPEFPMTEEEVRKRQQTCSRACDTNSESILQQDLTLNLSATFMNLLETTLAPHGIPETPQNSYGICLINRNSLIGFSRHLQLPLWGSFLLRQNLIVDLGIISVESSCIRNDVRLGKNETLSCEDLHLFFTGELEGVHLIPPALFEYDSLVSTDERIITNVVPMYRVFKNGIWLAFWKMIAEWSKLSSQIDIQIGPVFDDIAPFGIADPYSNITRHPANTDIRIPSHFFAIVTKTAENISSCIGQQCLLETMGFILPHDKEPRSACQNERSYLLTHSARVQDVEVATGLRFFTRLPPYERIRLLTQLPTKLWDSHKGL